MVGGQPKQIVLKTSSPKKTKAKWTGGVVPAFRVPALQLRSPELNRSPTKKRKRKLH
jgi:hypothetical protein